MDLFRCSEIAFNHTYFPESYGRTVRIKTGNHCSAVSSRNCCSDAPVQSLSVMDVPPSAGSFPFAQDGTAYENRFIVW